MRVADRALDIEAVDERDFLEQRDRGFRVELVDLPRRRQERRRRGRLFRCVVLNLREAFGTVLGAQRNIDVAGGQFEQLAGDVADHRLQLGIDIAETVRRDRVQHSFSDAAGAAEQVDRNAALRHCADVRIADGAAETRDIERAAAIGELRQLPTETFATRNDG